MADDMSALLLPETMSMGLATVAPDVVRALGGSTNGVNLRMGTIVSNQGDGTFTVTVAGSTAQVAGVRSLNVGGLVPGAVCWFAVRGSSLLILGATMPSGDGVWRNLTLGNSWTNYGGSFPTAQYMRMGGIVYVKGLITGGTYGTTVATLPAGYRPAENHLFAAITNTPTTGAASTGTAHTHGLPSFAARVNVSNTGAISIQTPSAGSYDNGFQSLSGISFVAEQ